MATLTRRMAVLLNGSGSQCLVDEVYDSITFAVSSIKVTNNWPVSYTWTLLNTAIPAQTVTRVVSANTVDDFSIVAAITFTLASTLESPGGWIWQG